MIRSRSMKRLLPKGNPTLEFFIITTKGLLSDPKLENENYCHELFNNLCKINTQIEICDDFQEAIILLIRYDFYTLLGQLDIHRLNHGLFEQQTLSFKRLINFCCNKWINHNSIELKISKIFGIYLINFSDYYDMTNIQKVYIKRIVPTIIEIYLEYPNMMKYWFDMIKEDNEVILFLKKKNKKIFPISLSNHKYLPMYDLTRSFIFIEEDLSKLDSLINLYQIDNSSLKEWLEKKSDAQELFIEKFLDCYNNSILNKSTKNDFKRYLIAFYEILSRAPISIRNVFLDKFRVDFLEEILLIDANATACLYITWSLSLMLPYKLENFLGSIIGGELFTSFLCQMRKIGKKEEILILNLITKLISFDEYYFSLFFKIGEPKSNNTYMNEIRIKAMSIMKYDNANIAKMLSKRINITMMSNKTLCHNEIISNFIISYLLIFFQNSNEFNESLLNLLDKLSSKVTLISNEKFSLALDFLHEIYLIYVKIIEKMGFEKYETLYSLKSEPYSYMLPSKKIQEILEVEIDEETKIVKWDELASNLRLYENLIIQLYADSKIRDIIYKT